MHVVVHLSVWGICNHNPCGWELRIPTVIVTSIEGDFLPKYDWILLDGLHFLCGMMSNPLYFISAYFTLGSRASIESISSFYTVSTHSSYGINYGEDFSSCTDF